MFWEVPPIDENLTPNPSVIFINNFHINCFGKSQVLNLLIKMLLMKALFNLPPFENICCRRLHVDLCEFRLKSKNQMLRNLVL